MLPVETRSAGVRPAFAGASRPRSTDSAKADPPLKILIVNQPFYPDVVSTAQHATDLAIALAERGHDVTVIASSRGYDNPQVRFPRTESWRGVRILRLPCTGLGKSAKWRRIVDSLTFMVSCVARMLALKGQDVVLAMTSPPLISFLAALMVPLKARTLVFWAMDVNPDQAIAAGWLRADSLAARMLTWIQIFTLRRAQKTIVLDRFMKERFMAKGIPADKFVVLPPWSHDVVQFDPAGRTEFRAQHGLTDKFVVMYSGNHSPCHPLDTLLQAAQQLSGHPEIQFCFVGGGSEWVRVQEFARAHQLTNITCLPYQPLEKLGGSLSAADLHVVVMGDAFRGIVHPCKIYNVITLGTPFLYIGPAESHITDILLEDPGRWRAWTAAHGEVSRVVEHILQGSQTAAARSQTEAGRFSQQALLPQMIEVLESATVAARV